MIHMYLDRIGVAERIGVKPDSLSRYRLPKPDAIIGTGPKARKGWLPKTIDAWNAQRPGRGWWGETPRGKRRGGRKPRDNSTIHLPGGISEQQAQRMEAERKIHEAESAAAERKSQRLAVTEVREEILDAAERVRREALEVQTEAG